MAATRATVGTGAVHPIKIACRNIYRRKKWRGHFDEVFAEISGVTHCLWCAGDHEREVLESVDATVRDRNAEQTWLKKPMKR
jgi:hypothetical protein